MIWLTWRQQRLEIVIAAALLALLTTLLLITGLDMASAYQHTGVAACLGPHPGQNCATVINAFQTRFASLNDLVGWLNFLPLIFGLLFGAPFVLELEQGTYRLAWTQSITRIQWIVIKLTVIAVLAVLAALIFTALMTWWRIPFDHLNGRFDANTGFDFEGTAPLAYALFAVALGITSGTLMRRTIPAIGLSLVLYLGVRLGIQGFLRPWYLAPLKTVTNFAGHAVTVTGIDRNAGATGPNHGDWIINSGWSDRLGHPVSDNLIFQTCNPTVIVDKHGMMSCLAAHHFYSFETYQPASRFWLFQGIETGIFLGLTAILLAMTIWWVRYRVT